MNSISILIMYSFLLVSDYIIFKNIWKEKKKDFVNNILIIF